MVKHIIETNNLSKQFGSGAYALKNLCLKVKAGEIYGIIGMSGAGKSTLLRCLTGLEKPTAGTIFLNDEAITTSSPDDVLRLRQEMGMVFQHFQLFSSRTAAQNIAYPLEIRGISRSEQETRIAELLSLVGLKGKQDHYPSQLSGGEKQRVGIARALAYQPKLLLCDEPTSALDAKTTRSILQLLQNLNKQLGLTIILITHQLETVKQICQRVAVLSHGEIIEEGTVIDIFSRPQHPITKHLVHLDVDNIPQEILMNRDPEKKLVRLAFEGKSAKEPVLSYLIKHFDVDANILSGGLDYVQNEIIGSLFVEFNGHPEKIDQAIAYLQQKHITCEVLS